MGVAAIGTKLVHWSAPEPSLSGIRSYLADIGVSAHQDVAFAAAVGVAGAAWLRFLRGRARAQSVFWWLYLAFCLACVVFSVASIQIFAFLRSPLTYALLYLADDFGNMRSSLGAFVTPPIAAAFVCVPLAWAGLSYWSLRRRPLADRGREAAAIASVCLLWWFLAGHTAYEGRWHDRDDHLIAKSPHWALVSSYAAELLGLQTAERFQQSYPEEYLADFAPARPSQGFVSAFAKRPRPKNAILVVLESTSAKYLSVHGSKYDTTPNLSAEAGHAIVDDAFYCHAGLTANSVAAITLSLYPYMTWREYTAEYPDLPGETLAQVLKRRGYRTAFIHSGDFQYVNQRAFLTGRGFDVLWDWRDLGAPLFTSWATHDQALFDGVLKWIDADKGQPFFVKVWTHMSHHPYEPMPGRPWIDFFKDGELPPDDYDLGRHLNTIHFVDEQLGRLFAFLRERGLADDTLVLVTGDHGEAFGDPHGAWGHGSRVYDECSRVPLVVWSPRLFPNGERTRKVGGHVDVNPTIADVLGVPPSPSWRGRSLFDPRRTGRAYFYAANDDYLLGVREGKWKYIYNATRGRDELYDMEADPQELKNVAREHAELCQRLRQRLAAWRDDTGRHLAQIRAARGSRGGS
jgi:arylsulfatase A-like enzyme